MIDELGGEDWVGFEAELDQLSMSVHAGSLSSQ